MGSGALREKLTFVARPPLDIAIAGLYTAIHAMTPRQLPGMDARVKPGQARA